MGPRVDPAARVEQCPRRLCEAVDRLTVKPSLPWGLASLRAEGKE